MGINLFRVDRGVPAITSPWKLVNGWWAYDVCTKKLKMGHRALLSSSTEVTSKTMKWYEICDLSQFVNSMLPVAFYKGIGTVITTSEFYRITAARQMEEEWDVAPDAFLATFSDRRGWMERRSRNRTALVIQPLKGWKQPKEAQVFLSCLKGQKHPRFLKSTVKLIIVSNRVKLGLKMIFSTFNQLDLLISDMNIWFGSTPPPSKSHQWRFSWGFPTKSVSSSWFLTVISGRVFIQEICSAKKSVNLEPILVALFQPASQATSSEYLVALLCQGFQVKAARSLLKRCRFGLGNPGKSVETNIRRVQQG